MLLSVGVNCTNKKFELSKKPKAEASDITLEARPNLNQVGL